MGRGNKRKKEARDIACITLIALLIAPLIVFGATQNITEQNITLPENVTLFKNLTEFNKTQPQPENITDITAPIFTILSPTNTTYNTTAICLNYTIDEPTDWVGYSLNGASNVTIFMDNTTFNASAGLNDLVVYARDTAGNIGKAEVQFTVDINVTTENITDVTEYLNITITPKLKLIKTKDHFRADEEPEFIFKFEFEHTGEEKAFGIAAAENETIETFVYDSSGELTDIEPEIEKIRAGKFSIKLPRERAFRAGLYKLSVELVRDERVFVVEREFPWGLVSLNTRKSIYKPGETAEFVIVVLDKEGHSVCDADISMTVTNPDNEKTVYRTSDGTILPGEECGLYNADHLTEVEGNHTITVNALIGDVEVAFDTYFSVQQDYAFDIVRTAQSKIDPTRQDRFEVRIDIESFTDADSLTIKEFVPASFNISTDAATVLLEDDTKTITWNKDLVDNKASISYSYDVPHIWPYLYALGPAEINYDGKTFMEARPWYVAVDPPDTETLTPDSLTGTVSNLIADVQSSNDFRIGVDGGGTGGVTFTDTSIPSGSTINSVIIYYEHWEETGHDLDSTTIRVGNSTNASAFGSGTVTDNIGPNKNDQGVAVPEEDTDSFTCSPTPLLSQLNDLQVEFFNNDGNDEMWIDYINATVDYALPVTITLISQDPTTIYANSTGTFNVTWGISHPSAALNNSSVSFIYSILHLDAETHNHSARVPSNNRSALCSVTGEYILRADNRNGTLNFENNDTITDGNVYEWGGGDENTSRLTIEYINDTYTYVHWNGTLQDTVFQNMWYLDRNEMEAAEKTQYSIDLNHSLLVKIWDLEAIMGYSDHITSIYMDTALGAASPTQPVEIYYLNESYDPEGGTNPEDSPYDFYLDSFNATTWVDHVYEPCPNCSYINFYINASAIENAGINVTNTGWIYLKSQTPADNPYYINITNVSTSTNRSFAETNVTYNGTSAPFAEYAYTPNIFLAFMRDNHQFQMKLYAADTAGYWGNSSLSTTNIGTCYFPPTTPDINHFHYAGAVDYAMSGTYTGTFEIGVGVATDPDGGNVTHNLTLHYGNRTFVAIINNTFNDTDITHNGVYAGISFDSTSYSSVPNYTLRCVATDNEGETSETWLGVNFTLDHQSPTITIDVPTEASPVYKKGGELFYVNFTYTEENPKNYTVTIYNSTATINTSSNTIYTPNSYVNVSFYLNTTAADGWYNVSVEMYDNASNYNISYQNESVVKMSWSNVTWISPPDESSYEVGETITLTCLVRDANTSASIENYPVHFYNRTDSTVTYDFGVNYTNSSGCAVMDWDTTGVAAGWYYPMCNITDNATLFYNVSADNETNTSIKLYATTLEIKNQTNVTAINSINFSGASGDTVSDPWNNVDGSESKQDINTPTPVATIYNPSSSTNYKIWLKVTTGTGWDNIISDEKFNVTDDGVSPGDISTWKSLKKDGQWGELTDSGVTVSAGTHNDTYLAFYLKGSGTGSSTLSVLGEKV